MGVIRVKKQKYENASCGVEARFDITLEGFIDENLAGNLKLAFFPSKNQAWVYASEINMHSLAEDVYNLKYSLIFFATALTVASGYKRLYISRTLDINSTPTSFNHLKRIEELFCAYDRAAPLSEWTIEKDLFSPISFNEIDEFIRIPHGELFIPHPNEAFQVLEGSVELSSESPPVFAPFSPRDCIQKGCHFVGTPVVAQNTVDLVKLKNREGISTQAEKKINYSASFYNTMIISYVLHALKDLKWIDYVKNSCPGSKFSLEETMKALGIQKHQLFYEMLRYLELAQLLHFDADKKSYTCSLDFLHNIERDFGYLQFLIYGYDHVLKELAPLATGEKKYGKDIKKNMGLKLFNYFYNSYKKDIEPSLLKAIDYVAPKHVVHIACGSAVRLIQLCQDYPHLKATGLDYEASVCEIARKNVENAGLSDRIKIVHGDVFDWVKEKHEDVDLVLLIEGIFHDFHHMPEGAQPLLSQLSQAIAPHAYLLVEDQNVSKREEKHFPQSIADGFEFLHTVMNATMFTQDDYVQLMESSGWKVHLIQGTELAQDWLYLLKNKSEKDLLVEAAEYRESQLREKASTTLAPLKFLNAPLAKIIANSITNEDDGSSDIYLSRTDDLYVKAKSLQKQYLDEHLVQKLIQHLQGLLAKESEDLTLVVAGIESYVLAPAIEALLSEGKNCSSLNLVIVDPLQKEIDLELQQLKNLEEKYHSKLGRILTFAKCLETLTQEEWKNVKQLSSSFLVFANLSLHFISNEKQRNELLAEFNQLGKVRLWIRERELDLYNVNNLPQKVSIAWDYFSPRFRQITQFNCSVEDKEILYKWYSLQVKDALNARESVACTHLCESGKKWLKRAVDAGFKNIEIGAVAEPSIMNKDGQPTTDADQAEFFTIVQCKNF